MSTKTKHQLKFQAKVVYFSKQNLQILFAFYLKNHNQMLLLLLFLLNQQCKYIEDMKVIVRVLLAP